MFVYILSYDSATVDSQPIDSDLPYTQQLKHCATELSFPDTNLITICTICITKNTIIAVIARLTKVCCPFLISAFFAQISCLT